jgi:hypothetical protein
MELKDGTIVPFLHEKSGTRCYLTDLETIKRFRKEGTLSKHFCINKIENQLRYNREAIERAHKRPTREERIQKLFG